ncbi:MAG TPA: PAS-domain containing protein [Ferrovibrio sp.]|uniref:PAS-domain containing protein n=1 Tax=Ferrovibrio sp. TaxID=1917215 RepID=UPI002B4AE567|nr:PAS-domain containing protein [Ferrovibrio sp.]HLT78721.1 PAS-domain containing protein [Ferrovibrio sp.]
MLQVPFRAGAPQAGEAGEALGWTGEFRDPEVEARYRDGRLPAVRSMMQACFIAATAAFVLLALRDFRLHGFNDRFQWALAIRLLGLIFGIGLITIVPKMQTARRLHSVGTIATFGFTILILVTWMIAAPPPNYLGALIFAVLLTYYLLMPIPALAILFNAAFLTLGTLGIGLFWFGIPLDVVVVVTVMVAAGNGLGLMGMRRFKAERRLTYLAQQEARRMTEALTSARQETSRRTEYQAWALDALQVGVLLFSPDRHLHSINRRAIELLALPLDAFRPGDHYEVLIQALVERNEFGQLGADDIRQHIRRLVQGQASSLSARLSSTGKVLEFTLGHLPDGSLAMVISDATERYALHRRLRHSVEVAGDGFALYDASDRIAICSSRFAALYGLTVDQTIGMSYEELLARAYERGVFDPAETGPGSTAVAGQTRRRIPERMIEIRTRAGEWFLVHERITPAGDLVVVRTNITARRRMEDDLRRAKEEAERALAELRDAQANLVMAEKMASLGSLVAGMSHEISTPLGIGVSAASHMSDEIAKLAGAFSTGDLSRSHLQDFLESATEANRIMEANLTRAARLIQAFKQIAADQSNDEIRSFRVAEYLRELMLSLAPALRKVRHRVEIDCPEDLVIRNRPGAFGQIVTNLVMNAVQHAFEGREEPGRIRIVVTQPRPGRVSIEFSDNGHGIAEEFLPKVFDPFFTTKRGAGGTGLGLHIVYNLVSQVLGGAIAISSREWEGTRFTISFPQDAKTE